VRTGIGYSPTREDVLRYYGVRGDSPILDELYVGVRDRALVVADHKKALAHLREKPTFPKSRDDLAETLASWIEKPDNRAGFPGLHCTHAVYDEPPKRYGDSGTWKAFHFFVDIDSKRDLEEARKVTTAMCEELDRYDVPYMIKFSGLAGFHIHIDYGSFPRKIDGRELIYICPRLYQKLKVHLISKACRTFGWTTTPVHPSQYRKDTSGLQRVEYSLHEHSGLVSRPMRREELPGFKLTDALISKVEILDDWRRVGPSSSLDALVSELGDVRPWPVRLFFG
jgi:hypothetical protein